MAMRSLDYARDDNSVITGSRPAISYLLSAVATSTAQATLQPTIGLLQIPMNPIRRFVFPSAAVQGT